LAKLVEGDAAPDFELPEASERIVRLSDELAKGAVMLVFYPTDWGMICTLEMKAFLELRPELERAGVRVLAVSVNSTTSHRAWKEQMGIPWDLLSDVAGKVASLYGVLIPDGRFLEGHAERSVFIIDRDRRVRFAWTAPEHSIQPDYEEILDAVRRMTAPHQSG
jgi:peroxiredoxin